MSKPTLPEPQIVYQRTGLPSLFCPKCAADATLSEGKYTCPDCKHQWPLTLAVPLPSARMLVARAARNPEFKKRLMAECVPVTARLMLLLHDIRTYGKEFALARAKSGYYKKAVPKEAPHDTGVDSSRNPAGGGDSGGGTHGEAGRTGEPATP